MQPVFKGSTPNSVLALSLIKGNPHLACDARARVQNAAPARRHWGSNGTRTGSDIRKGIALDNADEATPRGSVSAALGGGHQVPDRHLRRLMLLERGDPLVSMMMAEMLVLMPAHFGIGVQHAVLGLRGLDHRY